MDMVAADFIVDEYLVWIVLAVREILMTMADLKRFIKYVHI
jgi:hypothetical protein